MERDLKALITLLDDNDTEVYNHVFNKLLSYGPEIIPTLEHVWSDTFNPDMHDRLEVLIHSIQFEGLYRDFENYCKQGVFDLLKGASLIARYAYPEFKSEDLQADISRIKREIWLELNYSLTPLEQINVMNQVFFNNLGFGIDHVQHLDESDFYINKLIESKKAHPILVGLLYTVLARKLDFPVYGLNLPNHFALTFCRPSRLAHFPDADDQRLHVIFYINPQNKGSIFTKNEIDEYLSKMEIETKAKKHTRF